MSIQNVTIIGMGALGTMFGTEIQTKLGQDHVSFLMDKERFEKNSQKTYLVNGTPAGFRLITPDMASPADLIIVSTKATGLISALDTMERSVGPNTIIISAINGVRSEDILIDRFGHSRCRTGNGRHVLRLRTHFSPTRHLLPRNHRFFHAGETR